MPKSRSIASNAALALFVLAIAVMLLVPLPTAALDVLLALNISFAFLLLLVGLYMPNALALLSFPSVLLLTTLFRLSLNVASTRLILSQGEAGRVIEAFGSFLIQGELVVGVLIFIIITVVNFIVIARGASRVSEVAARFALDALPGKQMAIDADLRSGVLSPQEAEQKRETLRMESQLYGSMDGAMKFVQGDAIAGFFIIFANILGGMYLGVQQGLTFGEAVQTYVMLTVGDGLVSQIPALLISICAGIVVTRVASGKNTTLGTDLGQQLFQSPVLVFLTAFVALVIGSLPGVPFSPFLLISLLFAFSALLIVRRKAEIKASGSPGVSQSYDPVLGVTTYEALPEPTGSSGALTYAERSLDNRIGIEFDSTVLFRMYNRQQSYYEERWKLLKHDFFQSSGLEFPDVGVLPNTHLSRGEFQLSISGSVVIKEKINPDSLLVEAVPDVAESFGFEVLSVEKHPMSGAEVIWVPASAMQRRIADAAEMRVFDPVEYIFLKSAIFLRNNPEEIITITDVHTILKRIEKDFPGLVADAFSGPFMNVSRITDILQELSREGISIKDIKQVLEAIASYCATYSSSMIESNDFDLQDVISFVRAYRKRSVTSGLLSYRGTLRLCTLSEAVENLIGSARYDSHGKILNLSVDQFDGLRAGFKSLLEPIRRRGVLPVAILVAPELRHKVTALIRSLNDTVRVVTFDELDPALRVEPVGIWGIESF